MNIVCLFAVALTPPVRIWVAKRGLDSASAVCYLNFCETRVDYIFLLLLQKSLHKILATRGAPAWFHIMLLKMNENELVFAEFLQITGRD